MLSSTKIHIVFVKIYKWYFCALIALEIVTENR